MHIKHILSGLAAYLHSSRRVGHTTAMIRGAENTEAVTVLAHTQAYATQLQRLIPSAKVISMHGIDDLIGRKSPLVVDNSALWDICESALAEIKQAETSMSILAKANAQLVDENNQHRREINRLTDVVRSLQSEIEKGKEQ